jgi:hypothetical protein
MLMRPASNSTPSRKIVGTDSTCRASTSAWNSAAVDRDMLDARVEHAHRVQRLDGVRAALAMQRHVGFEAVVAGQRADLRRQRLVDASPGGRRPAAGPAPAR